MADKLGIGIIGAGHISRHHLEALAGTPEAVCRGIVDVIAERAAQRAEEFHIPDRGTDYRVLLDDPTVDAVIVCTPPYAHAEPTIAALEAGKHVLCEKPFALDVAEADAMVAAAERTGNFLCMASARSRLHPALMAARKLVEDGALGRVYHARTTFLRQRGRPAIDILPGINWFVDRQLAGGGTLIDIGVYELDIMMWLMDNAQPRLVLATTTEEVGGPPPAGVNCDVEFHATVMITMADGASLLVESAWAANSPQGGERRLLGTQGGLTFEPLTLWTENAEGKVVGTEVPVEKHEPRDPLHSLQRHFAVEVLAGRPPMTPARHALAVTKIIDAAYRSAETGQAVAV